MARLAIFLDSDITIRHFVSNGVLPRLEKDHDVTFIFPQDHPRVKTDISSLKVGRSKTISINKNRAHLWRRLYHHQVLRQARQGLNKAFLYDFWREQLGSRTFWKTWLVSFNPLYSIYKKFTLRKIGKNLPLESILSEIQPDVIIHPTVLEGLFVSDLIHWGRAHGVPTVYLMNSWDNPSTKAMTVGQPDWLVVWGPQTREHAEKHLKISRERILEFGAAQFDIYRTPPSVSREEFLGKLGIPLDRKVILYAGSSKQVKEVQHLVELEKAIEDGRLKNCHTIFRPHPWRGVVEGEWDFNSIPWKHVTMDSAMATYYKASRENGKVMGTSDLEYTHAILSACDLIVSPVSTILLEAALHNKPMLAYLPEEDIDRNFFLRTMANMNFMEDFFVKTECGPIRTMSELIRRIAEELSGSPIDRQEVADYFVARSPKPYGEQLDDLIDRIL